MLSQKSNRWKEAYNPLRGLSLARLNGLLEAGERGQYSDLQWFYWFMERSDPTIFAVMQRRRAALMASDWDIRLVTEADQGLAKAQADVLRAAYDKLENFREAVAFLFTGIFRGYAHLEKHYGAGNEVERLEPVEQWFWVRDGMFGAWEYNENAVSGRVHGIPVQRADFVVLEATAINRLFAKLFFDRCMAQKDYAAWLAVFGIPATFLVGPPNVPKTEEPEYQRIAEELISDGRGYLPNGSDLKYVNGGAARPPFLDRLAQIDKDIVLVGAGGLLTMLAEPGSGTLAGGAHQRAFLDIARGDAALLSEVFQRDFDLLLLSELFPDEPVAAYFEFAPKDAGEASRVLDDAVKLVAAGVSPSFAGTQRFRAKSVRFQSQVPDISCGFRFVVPINA